MTTENGYIDKPVPFSGTDEEAQVNLQSHTWVNYFGDPVCADCDCKIWYESALYPCGAEVPRMTVLL